MSFGIQYLCFLVETKNEINRRRRRFYNIMKPRLRSHPLPLSRAALDRSYRLPVHKAYSLMEAEQGYKKAQRDMRAMTREMAMIRKDIGARFTWACSGHILQVALGSEIYNAKDIKRLAESYRVDSILLGD